MPTVLQFARTVQGIGPAVQEAQVRGVRESALLSTTIIREQIRAVAPGGTLKMNGKPKKIGASFKMRGGARALISAEGPLHLVERDTQAHFIPRAAQSTRIRFTVSRSTGQVTGVKRRARRGKAGQGKILNIPGIGFRRMVSHPGTKGRHPFARGLDRARPQVGVTILAEVAKGLRAALR